MRREEREARFSVRQHPVHIAFREALDKVHKSEYARITGPKRKFIKGQKYVLLSHRENLTPEGKRSLKLLLKTNKRLNTAYLLREQFDQLWDYKSEPWARKFFDNWKAQLRWQRLAPFQKFAAMIERHWDGIAAYCKPANKVALGFVEAAQQQNPHHEPASAMKPDRSYPLKNTKSLPFYATGVASAFGAREAPHDMKQ